jgi:phosphoglycolate phosphatase
VGDRRHDMEAGRKNGILTIGCAYGFARPGELDGADRIITNVAELRDIF